ncbi:MAG TPA: SIMPL domain-containing protein [Caldilineaceae bacterium]|nr:SIMPL domain-containing protein [Caldilineaceae bacterium]
MNRKTILTMISALLLLAFGFTPRGATTLGSATAYAQDSTNAAVSTRTVSVSGSGQIHVRPDIAVVQVGVQTSAEEATAALNANNEQMQALIDALTKAGVAQDNIQTQTIQLQPQYPAGAGATPPQPEAGSAQSTNTSPEITGYIATNTVEVQVNEIDNLGSLLDSVVAAGGNQINSIRFEISEANAALQQARETAWEDAQQKAEQLATLAGAELGDVLTISEFSRGPIPVAETSMAVRDTSAVPVQPGTQDVNVELQVTWQLQ